MTPAVVDLVVPVALWLGATLVARGAGFAMLIPWDYYQLLDGHALLAHPLASFCYLHSQPPGLNALLLVVLEIANLLGCKPESAATGLFAVLGMVAAVALYRVIRMLTASRVIAGLGLLVVLADPGYHIFANLFFYEFVVYVLLVLLVAAVVRHLDAGSAASLVGLALVLGAISLTRSLFHPTWGIGIFLLVVLLRRGLAPPGPGSVRHALGAFALLLVLLVAWPAKNAVVYGRFLTASMSAYSLARGVPGCDISPLIQHMTTGKMPPAAIELVIRAQEHCGAAGAEVVTASIKSDGTGNWNNAVHLAVAPDFQACATAWVRQYPADWLRRAAGQYAMGTRPSFVDPYTGSMLGPATPGYQRYAGWWERTLFADLRPFIQTRWPQLFVHAYALIRSKPVPYTLFGVVLLPGLVVVLLVQAVRSRRRLQGALALVVLAVALWPIVAAALTDGKEGNRMRFATTPVVMTGVCLLRRRRAG